jgi:hypothetical protein
MSSHDNLEQLRADIDSGRTGDKVAAPDPAMAPLGTDDEAAGTPPSSADCFDAAARNLASSSTSAANRTGPRLDIDRLHSGSRNSYRGLGLSIGNNLMPRKDLRRGGLPAGLNLQPENRGKA